MSNTQLHDQHHAEPDYGMAKKTLGFYVSGIILCIALTLIPFLSVMHKLASHSMTIAIILVCALLQFSVQVICFLRLNASTPQAKMNVMAFVFSIVVLAVLIGGSVWIMTHLAYNMMH